jgi:hypothetical protein
MPDVNPTPAATPIVVSGNAGIFDTLAAAGRLLVIVVAAVPVLVALLKAHDLAAIIAYFQGSDGATLLAAGAGLLAIIMGLLKTHKRGAQIATVAADTRVPDAVAQLK